MSSTDVLFSICSPKYFSKGGTISNSRNEGVDITNIRSST